MLRFVHHHYQINTVKLTESWTVETKLSKIENNLISSELNEYAILRRLEHNESTHFRPLCIILCSLLDKQGRTHNYTR